MSADEFPLDDLNCFERDLLAVVVNCGPDIGIRLADELEHCYGESVTHGRLYPNLDRLAEKGLIEKQRNSRSNTYVATSRGEAVVDRLVAFYDGEQGGTDSALGRVEA